MANGEPLSHSEAAMNVRFVCGDCRNVFIQPQRCITCGAQKLYDNTVFSQAARIGALEALLIDWYTGVEIQRETGVPNIRNGVEHRMMAAAADILATQPYVSGEKS